MHRGLLWKTIVGVSVAAPVALGIQYVVSEPRERRKIRIVIEGFGRFFRFVSQETQETQSLLMS